MRKRLNKRAGIDVQCGVLRSVRELENMRLVTADGQPCGRIKDVYFNDQEWECRHFVAALDPRQFGQKQVLLAPETVCGIRDDQVLRLSLTRDQVAAAPLASSVLPVCKQYASLALASPGSSRLEASYIKADPYLRSARAVSNYRITAGGEFAGTLVDFLMDPLTWSIRYIGVQQIIDRKKLLFHVLPESVERFSWSTQRVFLKELLPVMLGESAAAAAIGEFAAA